MIRKMLLRIFSRTEKSAPETPAEGTTYEKQNPDEIDNGASDANIAMKDGTKEHGYIVHVMGEDPTGFWSNHYPFHAYDDARYKAESEAKDMDNYYVTIEFPNGYIETLVSDVS